jgi:catalase
VGNNIPVFFIQDATQFPDLIHAVKPQPDREIPQAATAHDTAWDFFSQQPSTLHTLFWAMSGHGTVRSYRHMDGWGVHTFRFVTDEGKTKLVKFRFRTLQGKASLLWEEAQVAAGKNADYHRQDLFESIDKGLFPEWVVSLIFTILFSKRMLAQFRKSWLGSTKPAVSIRESFQLCLPLHGKYLKPQ